MLDNEPREETKTAALTFMAPQTSRRTDTESDKSDSTAQTNEKLPPVSAAPIFAPPPKVDPKPAKSTRKSEKDDGNPPKGKDSGNRKKADKKAEERIPDAEFDSDDEDSDERKRRRGRRGRRGRGRGKGIGGSDQSDYDDNGDDDNEDDSGSKTETITTDGVTRRRRRRRKRLDAAEAADSDTRAKDEGDVVVKVRKSRSKSSSDDVRGVSGSTRLEAKRQRRREGRGNRRNRVQVVSESEFLARRESVERQMVVRTRGERSQIAVLEDNILAEHYVSRSGGQGLVGNVYLGKVQNVLPSMEAAFVDIGKGRNAVLYAGEVNWDSAGLAGKTRTIEGAMQPGDPVLVQVTKDPVGHKGARLTNHVALSGRHLVYVPGGNASGISRKLPDQERTRLRSALKKLVPEGAGVIVRTAAEGAGTDDLERDISRLQKEWEGIQAKSKKSTAPSLLYAEPDLLVRVVRDVFNEDFKEVLIDDADAHDEVRKYLESVSPELTTRLKRYTGSKDIFTEKRIDEQLIKALDRKVYLPSGGSLVIDRTEAMTVIDVNTGRFTGEGGNLEETVTRNNLEAAEEIVRQLRLRDIGGIIVIDFIDMVLESNRDLVLRRLTECLGRDRTKHQVTEVTSLGLVQMTRKRVGQGLVEAFSENCEHCRGRGVVINTDQILWEGKKTRKKGGRGNKQSQEPASKDDSSKHSKKKNGKSKPDSTEDEPTLEASEASTDEANDAAASPAAATDAPDGPSEPTPEAREPKPEERDVNGDDQAKADNES
ncbi:Rne/Rng family ribonuclease [Natronoglycomyces albus]|uniref:Ribonuclease E n=1 Tax=Natronoglycomyces albus TaxID=2811108 RepID=A0A895XJT8_9ACTN|nr:Rne/Rng family ribonuclease [Natronoglycomyces albus]QSB06021.1 Rne/Rng family ribonuclease [Natronoglycomyces albus]